MKQILVVDDDPVVLLILRETLEQMQRDYRVTTASDGLEALQKMESGTYDLVIADVVMPGMDGIDFVEAIRATGFDTVVIWITAYGCHLLEDEAARLNVFRCLEKPLRISNIRQASLNALKARPRSLEKE